MLSVANGDSRRRRHSSSALLLTNYAQPVASVCLANPGLRNWITRPSSFRPTASTDVSRFAEGGKVIFDIRLEPVNERESIDRNAKSVTTFDAKVEIVERAGSDTFVVTHVAGKQLTPRMRADTDVRGGESCAFRARS